jgi:hypothetical protein
MLKTLGCGLALVLASATAASALTVNNKSKHEITIGIFQGSKEAVRKIPAGQAITFKDECKYGCAVSGPWSFSWSAKPNDTITTDGTCLTCVPSKHAM